MIKSGSKVRIHYTLKVDGEEVDSSRGGDPLSYVHGQGQIIPGLEEALTGLSGGESKSVRVPPEKGYGTHDPDGVHEVSKEAFQSPEKLEVGGMVSGQASDGRSFQARVAEIGPETVTLDLNHPLAGKHLDFQVDVVEVA